MHIFSHKCSLITSSVLLATLAYSSTSVAESSASAEHWQTISQNELSPYFSLPFKYSYHDAGAIGGVSVGSVAPIMPIRFDGWNVINQLTLNFMGTPGGITGIDNLPEPYVNRDGHPGSDGYASGLADATLTSYVSSTIGDEFTYGFGPAFTFPTDEPSRSLGSGHFSVGPALMLVAQPENWTLSFKMQQIWSAFGSYKRADVSQMLIQPAVFYNLPSGWYVLSDLKMIANWNSPANDRWTVPVGAGVGKIFILGEHALDTRFDSYYNAANVEDGANWSVNASVKFIFGR